MITWTLIGSLSAVAILLALAVIETAKRSVK